MDVQVHDADGAGAFRQEVLEVWATAFGPVDDADDWRRSTWDRHRAREDYRLVTARVDDGRLAGFGWGYTGRRWAVLARPGGRPGLRLRPPRG